MNVMDLLWFALALLLLYGIWNWILERPKPGSPETERLPLSIHG